RTDRAPERADIAGDFQLELGGFGAALPMSSEKVAYLGMEFNIIAEQLPRCEVRRADAHLSIEHDDCSIDVLEQRLQAIPLVTQIVLLPPNRLRHVAECRDQKAEIGIRRHRHIDIELSSSHIARP